MKISTKESTLNSKSYFIKLLVLMVLVVLQLTSCSDGNISPSAILSSIDNLSGSIGPSSDSLAYTSDKSTDSIESDYSLNESSSSKPKDQTIELGENEQWIAEEYIFTSSKHSGKSLQTVIKKDSFEKNSALSEWTVLSSGKLSISSTIGHIDSNSLCMSQREARWDSPSYNIYDAVKDNGDGVYKINFWIYVDSLKDTNYINILLRGNSVLDSNSFITSQNGLYYAVLSDGIPVTSNKWIKCSTSVKILSTDLTRNEGSFNFTIDYLDPEESQNVYFDDFEIIKDQSSDVFNDITMEATFKGPHNTTMVIPAFWDGDNIWKVRFAPTLVGEWSYSTSCNDSSDTGLSNRTGKFLCTPYTGNLDLYKHGFVKTDPNKRYFIYADGTPFFYLGDTHWSMLREQFNDSSQKGIASQFKYIASKRVLQGYTVYQSQPLGIANKPNIYDLSDGITQEDIAGLKDMDARFKYIADIGLVHANSQFFFVTEITNKIYTKAYLDKLCRMWVARYAAYAVIWTTAQEIDNDLYAENGTSPFTESYNPWKYVTSQICLIDPYKHPATAHQEAACSIPDVGANASKSSFKNITGHSFFASQWTPSNNMQLDFSIPKDYWNNGQNKPTINYEGAYDHMWTMEFGARQQGWTAYLNGMFGAGYGAQDIWFFNSDFDMDTIHINGYETVTIKDKQLKWYDSINLPSATQLGIYMGKFFQSFEWWKLEPCFDDPEVRHVLISSGGYSAATISNQIYVVYFYNRTNQTGTLYGLEKGKNYSARWYNPRTGEYINIASNITGLGDRSFWTMPNKPDLNDWVILVKKAG